MRLPFRTPSSFSLLFVFLAVCGLLGSLKAVVTLFGLEGDSSHSLLLWQGVRAHGVGWLRDWLFTQDNWLFSLVPLHFLGFTLFGATPAVVVVSGWLIYVGSAVTTAAIAWRLGARAGALLIFLALINLGLYAHGAGFVSYSTSHNITNLFGLLALLLLVSWLQRPATGKALGLTLLLLAGALSDPWMLAAYNLPVLLLSLLLLVWRPARIGRRDVLLLAGLSAFSILAVQTQFFGLLSFLPTVDFALGDWQTWWHNGLYLIKDLGGLLRLLPFIGYNPLSGGLLSLLAIAALLLGAARCLLKAEGAAALDAATLALLLLIGIAVGGIALAFLLTRVQANDGSARFLISAAYLLVLALGLLADRAWRHAGPYYRRALALGFAGLLCASWASLLPVIRSPQLALRSDAVHDTIAFLEQHDLRYGYGPYWGSRANAVTAVSGGAVIIRPVVFDRQSGELLGGLRPESSKRWFHAEDVPPGTARFFVILVSDGEECADLALCLAGVRRQFGEPVETLVRGEQQILVWDRPLLHRSADLSLAADALPLSSSPRQARGAH